MSWIVALFVSFVLGLSATIHLLNRMTQERKAGKDPAAASVRSRGNRRLIACAPHDALWSTWRITSLSNFADTVNHAVFDNTRNFWVRL